MADDVLQIDEILSFLRPSNPHQDRSLAYAVLLQLQEKSANDSSTIQALSRQSPRLISRICFDIFDDDEEIAALALKCLGFMIYHASIVAAIPESVACLTVESLVKLISTTRMKAICNLGVWCISIQQFDESFIASHLNSLLRAVVHALDNPVGSLSTTFEAMQAVMKLATQLCEKMRDVSSVWAPPICKRLLSCDKRERDMSERCLLKIKSCILPPTPTLSKVIYVDIKKTLLPGMKDMLQEHGKKVHSIQAWGWCIRLLGSSAKGNRHLVNEMLKILEKTFSDPDQQVQIASLVAWEALIDALIQPPLLAKGQNIVQACCFEPNRPGLFIESRRGCEDQVDRLQKSIKLVMTPIIGIMSSKYDIHVRSSCLNTWRYLLHKLGLSVNHPSVLKTVLEPVLNVVFHSDPNSSSTWLWNSCVDLFDDFISSKVRDGDTDLSDLVNSYDLSTKAASAGAMFGSKDSWKDYPVKWLPWDFSKLDFHLKMIRILINQGLMITVNPENRKLALNNALRIFKTVLRGIQVELRKPSIHFDEIMLWINPVLKFAKWVGENVASNPTSVGISNLACTAMQFLELMRVELEPSILDSPLYRVPLDIMYINDLQSTNEIDYLKVLGISCMTYDDTVSPIVYLMILYHGMVAHFVGYLSETESIPQVLQNYAQFIFSSCDPSENLHTVICLLFMHAPKFMHVELYWLKLWRLLVKGLTEHIASVNDLSFLKTASSTASYEVIYSFLCYPIVRCYSLPELLTSMDISIISEPCLISSESKLELELAIEAWKSLFDSANSISQLQCSSINSFIEGLCKTFNTVINANVSMPQGTTGSRPSRKKQHMLFMFGEAASYLLKQIQVDDVAIRSRATKDQETTHEEHSIRNSLEFIARFLMLSLTIMETKVGAELIVISRVFAAMAAFAGGLYLKQDILLLMETFSNPLVEWMSSCSLLYREMNEGNTVRQLQIFWTQALDCLRKSQPAIIFDSSFLDIQAPLLQAALNHPYSPISDATIAFWKATYGEKKLHYPRCIRPVLHRLAKEGKINLHNRTSTFLVKSNSTVEELISSRHKYRVSATNQGTSKRVEFTKDIGNELEGVDIVPLGSERKRQKLADQQVKGQLIHPEGEWDSNQHGPGVKKSVDASCDQGILQTQGALELRKPEFIIEMLRRAG